MFYFIFGLFENLISFIMILFYLYKVTLLNLYDFLNFLFMVIGLYFKFYIYQFFIFIQFNFSFNLFNFLKVNYKNTLYYALEFAL